MLSRAVPDRQFRAHNILSIIKIKTDVQTARESHDLIMDYRSFDNGFKQLCVTKFMQEWHFVDRPIVSRFHVLRITGLVQLFAFFIRTSMY